MNGYKPAVVVLALALTACDQAPPTTVGGSSASRSAAQVHSRRDTPWATLSDDELTARVAQADGLVFIGFKDPSAHAGADERGRVLATSAAKIAARGLLAGAGATIEFVPQETPYVVARIPLAAISGLRHNPHIEYIEPILSNYHTSSEDTTWNVRRIGAVGAWSNSTGDGVVVQVIDTGIETNSELQPMVVQSCVPGIDGVDHYGHGTLVSSVIAAVNTQQASSASRQACLSGRRRLASTMLRSLPVTLLVRSILVVFLAPAS
jgi:subtilisin family serine protease